jgi:phosphomannomutase
MINFIFDVDGTLTPSRSRINEDFRLWFTDFCIKNNVYFVTGSDNTKTVEQLGEHLCRCSNLIYNCSGSDVWAKGERVRTNDWILPEDAHEWLSCILTDSLFPKRTGLHFEHRPGMVNFSIVGRGASAEDRAEYIAWDKEYNERKNIACNFNLMFKNLEAKVGGETGLDIAPRGADKSQILKDFNNSKEIYFFGDSMELDGNDYPLARAILDNNLGTCYNVKDWKDTWNILRNL